MRSRLSLNQRAAAFFSAWSPARSLWTLEDAARRASSSAAFIDAARHGCRQDHEWHLDFAAVQRHAVGAGWCPSTHESKALTGKVGAALACTASVVQRLTLVLASQDAVEAAAALLITPQFASRVSTLRFDVDVAALAADANVERRHAGRNWGKHILGDESAVDCGESLSVLRPVFEALSASSCPALCELTVSAVDSSLAAETPWGNTVAAELAAALQRLPSLSAVSLEYLHLRYCRADTLQQLALGVMRSARTLSRLQLAGMRAFLERGPLIEHGLVSQLTALMELDLGYTNLGDLRCIELLSALREGVGGWTHLRKLGLAQCQLGAGALQQLRLDAVSTREGEEVKGALCCNSDCCECLEELVLAGNLLTTEAVGHLSACLPHCPQLHTLDLRHCGLTGAATSAGELAAALTGLPQLRSLSLRSNRIGDVGLVALLAHVERWGSSLQELDITRCRLTCLSLPHLALGMTQLPALRVLRMGGNDMRNVALSVTGGTSIVEEGSKKDGAAGEDDLRLFAYDPAYMKGSAREEGKVPTSFELDRRDRETGRTRYKGPEGLTGIAARGGSTRTPPRKIASAPEAFMALGDALRKCCLLQVLDLSDASIPDENFLAFVRGITTLQEQKEGAVPTGSRHLALPLLRYLSFSANPLFSSVASVDALASLLACCTNLHSLDLAFTGLGDLGLSTLCDGMSNSAAATASSDGVLRDMKELETLQLSHSHVQTLGLEALAEALADLPALRVVRIDGNVPEEPDVVLRILEKSAELPSLQYMDLSGCVSASSASDEAGDHWDAQEAIDGACAALRSHGVTVMI